jgi:hypothetical protein
MRLIHHILLMNDVRGDYNKQWRHIEPLILIEAAKDFIVFIDKEGDVDWETTIAYDRNSTRNRNYDRDKCNSILTDAAFIEVTPCEGISNETRLQFKRLIGEAITCVFEFDYESATKALDSAKQFIRARSEEVSRFWYLSASFVVCAVFILTGLIIWLVRDPLAKLLTSLGIWIALATVAGAIGALLSVIWRSGDLKFSSSSGRKLHYLEAASRICAGALSGFLVALAVKSEIILSAFARGGNFHETMVVAAIAAGASERFAGSIISRFEVSDPSISGKKQAEE